MIGRIKKELLSVLPAFIFFLVMFHVMVVTKILVTGQYELLDEASLIAIVGALIVTKVVLIADKLPFLNLYPKKPLIWNVVLKTIVFNIATFLFMIAEELLRGTHARGSFIAALEHIRSAVFWPAFCARGIWLIILIFFYCSAREFFRVVGFGKVKEIFFGVNSRQGG